MLSVIDIEKIRADFPILSQEINGQPLIYFDNAATTQKPLVVIDAIRDFYLNTNANIHRAAHDLSEKATIAYEATRKRVRKFINAQSEQEIVFTKGTTDSLNLIAAGWGRKFLKPGAEIILTESEHHSNLIPWQILASERDLQLRFIKIQNDGRLDLAGFANLFSDKTKLVTFPHISNVLGTLNPARDICRMAHDHDCIAVIDGAQSVPHVPVDVVDIDCDFLTFSGHKMLGPTGVGVLYGKERILAEMDPYQGGGEMIAEVWLDRAEWNDLPYKFEAGTPNIAGVVAFKTALDYLENIGMSNIAAFEEGLTRYALERMNDVAEVKIYGHPYDRTGVITFNLGQIHAHDLAHYLNQYAIATRSGHHCAEPLIKSFGVNSTIRASLYFYNTKAEIDRFVDILQKAAFFFR